MNAIPTAVESLPSPTSIPPTSLSLARVVPMNAHAVVEYIGAAALIAAPFLYGWRGPAAAVSVASGAATLGVSLVTDYDLSLAKLVPIQVHAMADYMTGGLLAAAPAAAGYADSAPGRFHMAVGFAVLGMSLLTAYRPASDRSRATQPGTQLGMRLGAAGAEAGGAPEAAAHAI